MIGGAVSTIVTLGAANTLKPFGAPALTFPFVIVTWLPLLATYGFAGLPATALPAGVVVAPFEPASSLVMGLGDFLAGALQSISQVFLKTSAISALLLLAGLAVNSASAAAFALGGAILAVIVAHLFGAESDLISQGLLGFSPVLTAVALGVTFNRPSSPGRGLRCAWSRLHRYCAGRVEYRAPAFGDPRAYGALCSRLVDVPASA